MTVADDIRENLFAVRARIDAALLASGRVHQGMPTGGCSDAATSAWGRSDGGDAGGDRGVRLVAVTKRLAADAVRAAYAAGQRDFGENYVQEAVAKIGELKAEMAGARWHFIGRLQSNKAALAVGAFALLHGIDSPGTVAALSRAAEREGRVIDVLLQVRLGRRGGDGDARPRGGVDAEDARDFLEEANAHVGVRFVGLMGVADPDLHARPQFATLRVLASELAALRLERCPLGELSMGMTGDLEDAVAEGATIVRIGTAIFGERPGH